METLNRRDTGYRGIWYMNQPSGDEYVFKYSGGLGTYCAKHQPFAVYRPEVNKTFFCYGGTAPDENRLWHMVSFYDHATRSVPRPTVLLDKETTDAHDNPVISVDDDGFVWIFSTSHGVQRPSYIHRGREPYSVDAFDRVDATFVDDDAEAAFDNFSYMQAWHVPGAGFRCFLTRYRNPAVRTIGFISSADGRTWSDWRRLAAIEEGHYQISAANAAKVATTFNMHPTGKPGNGLNWRTNLYYLESLDGGETWRTIDGTRVDVPLTEPENPALVHHAQREGLNVYLKDIRLDADNRPVILYLVSPGYESGPANDPRTWMTARWTGSDWAIRPAMISQSNYDTGSLYLEPDGAWQIIAPTEPGPQPYNPGGEMVLWRSEDLGETWTRRKQLTHDSPRNHTYARRPVDVHPDFYALWADGNARAESESSLYFSSSDGTVHRLPREMNDDTHAFDN